MHLAINNVANDNLPKQPTHTRENFTALLMSILGDAFDQLPINEAEGVCLDIVTHALSISRVKLKFSVVMGERHEQ